MEGRQGAVTPIPSPNYVPREAQPRENANPVFLTPDGTKSDLGHDNVIAAWVKNNQKIIYTTLENV